MTIRILIQHSRTPKEIADGKTRRESWETLENVSDITKDGIYIVFRYTDGSSYAIDKDYLTRYEIV